LGAPSLGAEATGVDLSDAAIAKAKELATQTGLNAQFINSDVYELPQHLQGQFDVVFTSYGTIGWLLDLDKWASVINHFLKPGGKFIIVEFHPVVWMFYGDFSKIAYNYFKDQPIVETESGT
jgi:ubiquinone/menaquinone biosynthesis C-methylase UbiE